MPRFLQPPLGVCVSMAMAILMGCQAVPQPAQPVSQAAGIGMDEGLLTPDVKSLDQSLLGAAADGDALLVKQLLARSADVNAQDRLLGDTPLIKAVSGNHLAVARILLNAGANPNYQNHADISAFLLAALKGQTDMVRLLLDHGADLRSVDRYGSTALISACKRGYVETAQLLIAAGSNANHVNRVGWSCLTGAVELGNGGPAYQAIVKALIAAKADLNRPDKGGVTALAHAHLRGQLEVVRLLEAAGAR